MTVVCTKCGALSIAQCTCSVITHNQYVYGGAIQMTDISNLKPGSALTYEQAMALPDGAVVSAAWGDDLDRNCYTVGSNDAFGVPKKFGGSTLERKEYWRDYRWHSVRLESLPELPVWVIACERCGTTYKNNERHACVAREPSESSPGEGYRWLVTGVDVLRSGDEWKNQNGKFAPIPVWCVGGVADGAIMFRRRIEPQAEPAKPERPVYVSTCDRCGTNYWNNERHACATREPSEPSPGDGHRWVEVGELLNGADTQKVANGLWVRTVCEGFICEDALRYRRRIEPELDIGYRWVNIGERIIDTDEYLTSYGEWVQTGGLEFKCTVAKMYRRRIEPQAEPAKPERQASEIEKLAAWALLTDISPELHRLSKDDCGHVDAVLVLVDVCRQYIEAYDYAKSIGAIE